MVVPQAERIHTSFLSPASVDSLDVMALMIVELIDYWKRLAIHQHWVSLYTQFMRKTKNFK